MQSCRRRTRTAPGSEQRLLPDVTPDICSFWNTIFTEVVSFGKC